MTRHAGETELEARAEQWIGSLLRAGVLLAAAVVVTGAGVYVVRHGGEAPQLSVFAGEPEDLRSVEGILADARALRGRGLIQLGLLLLIATPIARVAFALGAFAAERDRTFVAVTALVLGLLLYGLLGGGP